MSEKLDIFNVTIVLKFINKTILQMNISTLQMNKSVITRIKFTTGC